MHDRDRARTSKFLSLILRHQPEGVGLELEPGGWVAIDALLAACSRNGRPLSLDQLRFIVERCEKQRFAFSEDGLRIRAQQGHSIEVDLELTPATPPDTLFHGTAERLLGSIRAQGLRKQKRHHVHLSADRDVAVTVGRRHGKPVILTVDVGAMVAAGQEFFVSGNGVWLVDHVPVEYLTVDGSERR